LVFEKFEKFEKVNIFQMHDSFGLWEVTNFQKGCKFLCVVNRSCLPVSGFAIRFTTSKRLGLLPRCKSVKHLNFETDNTFMSFVLKLSTAGQIVGQNAREKHKKAKIHITSQISLITASIAS
jgi:hypothetical protein